MTKPIAKLEAFVLLFAVIVIGISFAATLAISTSHELDRRTPFLISPTDPLDPEYVAALEHVRSTRLRGCENNTLAYRRHCDVFYTKEDAKIAQHNVNEKRRVQKDKHLTDEEILKQQEVRIKKHVLDKEATK